MRLAKLFVSAVISCLALVSVRSQIPGIISHQGKITVNGTNFTGNGQFKFALVDAPGTNTFWSQDGSSSGGSAPVSSVTLPVTRGVFSVYLGDTNVANMTQPIPGSVFTNSEVYLRTWFNDDLDGFQPLAPDQRLSAAPYALTAGYYAESDPVFGASVASTLTTNRVNSWDAAVSWGNHATNGYLTVTTGDARYLKTFTESDPVFSASAASGVQSADIANWNGKIGGSGSANYVPVFASGATLANSVIYANNSGNVGIGTAVPGQKLEVNGTVKSATGGFMFPDGSVQTTAATNTTSSGGSPTVLVQAYLTADVPLTPSAETQIIFNNAVTDVGSAYDAVSGTFTAPSTGVYMIQFYGVSATSPLNSKRAVLKKYGTEFFCGANSAGNTYITPTSAAPVTYFGPLTQGDAITFFITMNNPTGVTLLSGSSSGKSSLLIMKF